MEHEKISYEEYGKRLKVTQKPCIYYNKDFRCCNLKVELADAEKCSKCENYNNGVDKNV